LQDDGGESIYYANPPRLELGGTGLVSTAQDYLRFRRMMLNGGTLDGVQILSPKTVARFSLNYLPDGRELADMTLPGLFSGSTYAGVGFSLGGAVTVDIAKTRLPGSLGQYFWGGATGSAFWIDPKEELAVVFMTPGDLLRDERDMAPRLAHLGLFSDDRVVRVRSKLTELKGAGALVTGGNGGSGAAVRPTHACFSTASVSRPPPEIPEFSLDGELLRFFDTYLMELDTGLSREPQVHYSYMHAEAWREAALWPPVETTRRLFLGESGALSTSPGAGEDCFTVHFGFDTGRHTRYGRLAAHDIRTYYDDWQPREGDPALLPLRAARHRGRIRRTRCTEAASRSLRAGCSAACVSVRRRARRHRALRDRGGITRAAPEAVALPAELSGKLAIPQL
jgi:hypothetical protein